MQKLFTFAAITVTACLLSACGSGDSNQTSRAPKNIEEAAAKVDNVFKDANPEVSQAASNLSSALKERQFEAAAEQLDKFNNIPQLTYEQAVAIQESRNKLVENIASRIDTDPSAKRAWERMKASARDH